MNRSTHFEYRIEGRDFFNTGNASSEVKKVVKKLKIDSHDIKRIVVALYEAEVNVVAHASKGKIDVDINPERIFICLNDRRKFI